MSLCHLQKLYNAEFDWTVSACGEAVRMNQKRPVSRLEVGLTEESNETFQESWCSGRYLDPVPPRYKPCMLARDSTLSDSVEMSSEMINRNSLSRTKS
jgi:hypothetical protein